MILDFDSYIINESSLKKLKRQIHGSLDMKSRKRMRRELRDNIVTFKFKKRNGEIRTAHGTLHPDYLPKLRGGAPRPEHQMVYYDLDKNSWRSFRSYSFIKILNIKPVDVKSITVKPHTKSTKVEDEEEVKKIRPIEKEEEKEVKKPLHKEEYEEKKEEKVSKEKEEPESILDDKDTDEEKELVDKENEEEDEKKKTNESISTINQYPNVNILGDGEYDGVLWGHCFVYEGHKYYSKIGWKNMFPSYCKMIIHGDDTIPKQIDVYQRKELKKLFI